ncbi:MAG: hypothetical protein OXT09_10240 [Myxococcales bacterium]|nr:hypothetical protein [Myxococcales bacterium]
MRIAFIGDTHGRALHALEAAVGSCARRRERLDAIVQVGDFSALPRERFPTRDWYIEDNPSERDVLRALDPDPARAATLNPCREVLGVPVHFISPGALAIADTAAGTFEYLEESWLEEIAGDAFALGAYLVSQLEGTP